LSQANDRSTIQQMLAGTHRPSRPWAMAATLTVSFSHSPLPAAAAGSMDIWAAL
jgi:hypothetical protein